MNKTIKIAELISTDIRSRSNADKIRVAIKDANSEVVLDFSNVTFMSRSFADELYNIKTEYANICMVNMSDLVKSMFDAVCHGRSQKRKFDEDKSEMKSFSDIESLSAFLTTI